ncbi:hypothetical protein CO026_03425 [Candidatus Kaiserbacteria bacterium CG_4_9_14_0_2_um_filter_41_32]|uniref:Uncharacterized protein n=1 Tax=Candidatus Kaiserbacteria bacterium CG_4_9_14_0_2_um_filter_41_32 TaxID=1974601 RepID=A0A2M8FE28_9BACT|nr:MAG: hypothetical protein CO026_03425 [Candidatus Kaiserbacteria bacterium CG_4_9_14_0_2_um_filter_41_32]
MEQSPQTIRDIKEITALIDSAIREVALTFESELSDSDHIMLQMVVAERHTLPVGRVTYLRKLVEEESVSPSFKEAVNNVLLSLKQQLTDAEIKKLTGGIQTGLLDEIE